MASGVDRSLGDPSFETLSDSGISNPQNGQVIAYNATTGLWENSTSAGGVESVSNSDGTLTISPPTGAVTASLNLAHPNTWTALQTFGAGLTLTGSTNIVSNPAAATSTNTTVNSGYIDLLGSYWDGSASVPIGFRTTAVVSSTSPSAYWLLQFNNNGTLTQAGYLDNISHTSFGYGALNSNTGAGNSAFGFEALYSNTTGIENSAFGFEALYSNTTGISNSAFGYRALLSNTTGDLNSAFGMFASDQNTTGSANCAFGRSALFSNTTGSANCAFGYEALLRYKNTTSAAGYNVAVGYEAGYNYTGSEVDNIIVGFNEGVAGESNMIRIGNANSGITGQGQVAFSQIGLSGLGLSPIYGAGFLVSLGTTSTTVVSHTPTSSTGQSFCVKWRLSCVTASTPTLTLTYTDPKAGAQTITLYNTAMSANTVAQGTFNLVATNASPITVSGTDSVAAGDIFATVEIQQLQ